MSPNDKIRAFLAQKRMSQTDLAELCRVPHSRVNDVVNPKKQSDLTLKLALPIARAMGVGVDYLCDPETPWPPEGHSLMSGGAGPELPDIDRELLQVARRLDPDKGVALEILQLACRLGPDLALTRLLLIRPTRSGREATEADV